MSLFKYYPSNPKKLNPKMEKRIFFHSLILPTAFVFVFWIVEIIEQTIGISFVKFGVYPLNLKGLPGILFSPFIHSDFNHLLSNSVPFFILLTMLIYFYRRISYRLFFMLYFFAGVCLWLFGREAWHIGASGVVYAMAAFHIVSGIIRNDTRLLTLSVTVVFLYGGLVWGMLPINPDVSWEGHLWGAVSGVVLAWHYRKYTIRRDKFDWEEEEEDEGEEIGGGEDAIEETDKGGDEDEKIRFIPKEKGDLKAVNSANAEKPDRLEETEKPKRENNWPNNVSHTGKF